jgi:hypothetical protein
MFEFVETKNWIEPTYCFRQFLRQKLFHLFPSSFAFDIKQKKNEAKMMQQPVIVMSK